MSSEKWLWNQALPARAEPKLSASADLAPQPTASAAVRMYDADERLSANPPLAKAISASDRHNAAKKPSTFAASGSNTSHAWLDAGRQAVDPLEPQPDLPSLAQPEHDSKPAVSKQLEAKATYARSRHRRRLDNNVVPSSEAQGAAGTCTSASHQQPTGHRNEQSSGRHEHLQEAQKHIVQPMHVHGSHADSPAPADCREGSAKANSTSACEHQAALCHADLHEPLCLQTHTIAGPQPNPCAGPLPIPCTDAPLPNSHPGDQACVGQQHSTPHAAPQALPLTLTDAGPAVTPAAQAAQQQPDPAHADISFSCNSPHIELDIPAAAHAETSPSHNPPPMELDIPAAAHAETSPSHNPPAGELNMPAAAHAKRKRGRPKKQGNKQQPLQSNQKRLKRQNSTTPGEALPRPVEGPAQPDKPSHHAKRSKGDIHAPEQQAGPPKLADVPGAGAAHEGCEEQHVDQVTPMQPEAQVQQPLVHHAHHVQHAQQEQHHQQAQPAHDEQQAQDEQHSQQEQHDQQAQPAHAEQQAQDEQHSQQEQHDQQAQPAHDEQQAQQAQRAFQSQAPQQLATAPPSAAVIQPAAAGQDDRQQAVALQHDAYLPAGMTGGKAATDNGALPAGQQPDREMCLVGSGLDKAKLDQMKRLCRRLNGKASTSVDEHTTHVILKVS